MNVRAIIVDDEPLARDELSFLLSECDGIDVVDSTFDASSALASCERENPDAAFVDLRMPGVDGITLAQSLKARHPAMSIVVVSAHDDGALRAYDAEVLDYLLKPVRLERLRTTVERLKAAHTLAQSEAVQPVERIAVKRRGSYVVVEVHDIVYFETRDDLVWAITDTDRFGIDLTLAHLERSLPEGEFFRSHRAALVRLDRIHSIEPLGSGSSELVLQHPNAPRVPLARERVRTLRERIPFTG